MDAIEKGFKILKIRRRVELIVASVLIILLIIAVANGCHNNKLQLGQINQLIEKHHADSVKMFNDSVDYADHIQYAEDKLELNYNQYIAATDSIHTLWKKLDKLSAKHINIEPKWDTSIMQVPTEYVSECKECFDQLPIIKATTKYLEVRFDSLKTSAITKYSIQEKRIKQLNAEKSKLTALFNDCIAAANDQKKRYEPRRKVFLTFTGLTQFHEYTIGAGFGLLYMDKRERVFGGNGYATNHGGLYTASISFPLSFKRIK